MPGLKVDIIKIVFCYGQDIIVFRFQYAWSTIYKSLNAITRLEKTISLSASWRGGLRISHEEATKVADGIPGPIWPRKLSFYACPSGWPSAWQYRSRAMVNLSLQYAMDMDSTRPREVGLLAPPACSTQSSSILVSSPSHINTAF